MTVKIPIEEKEMLIDNMVASSPTPAWRNFINKHINPYAPAAIVNIEIAAALAEYDALWLRSEKVIEFASQEKAVMWLLRWS